MRTDGEPEPNDIERRAKGPRMGQTTLGQLPINDVITVDTNHLELAPQAAGLLALSLGLSPTKLTVLNT